MDVGEIEIAINNENQHRGLLVVGEFVVRVFIEETHEEHAVLVGECGVVRGKKRVQVVRADSVEAS